VFRLIAMVTLALAVATGEDESVTTTTRELFPAAVGVPLKLPLVLKFTPAGRVPDCTANEYGGVPPLAVSDWENGVPTCPVKLPLLNDNPAMMESENARCAVAPLESFTCTVKL